MKDEIGVITLDKKYQKALLTEGLVNPRALAIDLDNRKLYYSDWHRRNPHIGRVDLDGSSNQDFVKDDIGLPNGLTLLQNRRELCWVDAGKKQLSCIRLDGTGRRVVYAPLEYPFGLTHENEERFYWTDWKDNKIHSVSVYGQDYRSFSPSLVGQGKIYGILSLNHKCSESAF
jgi:sugar lactone lactonase YvrE